jgi:hypothetical protein
MNTSALTNDQIFAIIAAAALLIAVAIIAWAVSRRRTERLRAQFGPEYDRIVAQVGGRSKAEARLTERSERVHKLAIRPLTSAERDRFADEWSRVQTHFVDAPAGAVAEADQLLGDVLAICGYPVCDFEQRAADISVDHSVVTHNYRAAHNIALRHASGQASTEELRRAMIHYRTLFDELVGTPRTVDSRLVDSDVAVNDLTAQTVIYPQRRAS